MYLPNDAPLSSKKHNTGLNPLLCLSFNTPLGPMIAIADDNALFLLEFTDRRNIDAELIRLQKNKKSQCISGSNAILSSIKQEISEYFSGTLKTFKTPIQLQGTDFQKEVWNHLASIPYGKTYSYKQEAISLNKPKSFRAVANANGKNQLAIIIPCHRIISNDGSLGGYGAGLERKKWLLAHEKTHI